ncbi:sugar-phosphatase [Aeromonas schubertii]|uniref:sugar-phosphatase n=1 Tax=Aeromonas schubertii TaxID=652 RepID=UPI001CC3BCCA|nr:sugar-phosphatase [Aeromonas schubertii]MBZ6073329.1 sugar-phosphatase [Aeromonas schubertii]
MYKLIALDMDGTLLNHQKQISARNKAAIAAARQQGVTVVLASGRPLEGMSAYLEELGMTGEQDYVICYNGTLVQRAADRGVIRSQSLRGSDASRIASLAAELGVNVHAFSPERGLITPAMNHYTEHESRLNDLPVTLLDFAGLSPEEEILKVMLIDPPELLGPAIARLPAELYQAYTVVQSAPFFLEIMNRESHKGAGVAALAEHLGIARHQVICMGDAGNDSHMIDYAGLGIAMGNATDELKAMADHITASNDEDGVALAIERFVLGH